VTQQPDGPTGLAVRSRAIPATPRSWSQPRGYRGIRLASSREGGLPGTHVDFSDCSCVTGDRWTDREAHRRILREPTRSARNVFWAGLLAKTHAINRFPRRTHDPRRPVRHTGADVPKPDVLSGPHRCGLVRLTIPR
jgi:hypothetical protein